MHTYVNNSSLCIYAYCTQNVNMFSTHIWQRNWEHIADQSPHYWACPTTKITAQVNPNLRGLVRSPTESSMPRRTDRQLQSESDIKELILLQLSSRWKHQATQTL